METALMKFWKNRVLLLIGVLGLAACRSREWTDDALHAVPARSGAVIRLEWPSVEERAANKTWTALLASDSILRAMSYTLDSHCLPGASGWLAYHASGAKKHDWVVVWNQDQVPTWTADRMQTQHSMEGRPYNRGMVWSVTSPGGGLFYWGQKEGIVTLSAAETLVEEVLRRVDETDPGFACDSDDPFEGNIVGDGLPEEFPWRILHSQSADARIQSIVHDSIFGWTASGEGLWEEDPLISAVGEAEAAPLKISDWIFPGLQKLRGQIADSMDVGVEWYGQGSFRRPQARKYERAQDFWIVATEDSASALKAKEKGVFWKEIPETALSQTTRWGVLWSEDEATLQNVSQSIGQWASSDGLFLAEQWPARYHAFAVVALPKERAPLRWFGVVVQKEGRRMKWNAALVGKLTATQ